MHRLDLTSLASSVRPRVCSLYPHVKIGWLSHLQQSLSRNIKETPLEILVLVLDLFIVGSPKFGVFNRGIG